MAAELFDALEAVADRVAVGEELFGGGGDVAVVVEVGLDGGDELGLVLLVVGGERRHGLRVEALELTRVLADRGQQQPVGAGVLEGEQRAVLGLADVDREPRLVAGPVEVDRVGRAAAVADRQVEARQAVVELARQAGGGAGEALVVLGRDDHGDLGGGLALVRRRQRPRGERAQRPQGEGEDPGPPLAGLGGARRGADDQHPGPGLEVGAHLGGAGDDVAAVGHLAGQHGADEGAGDLLALPLRRARPLQLEREQRRHHARDRRVGLGLAAVAQLADHAVGDPQLDPGDVVATGDQLLLLVRGGAGDREDGAGAVDQGDAGVEHPGRGAGDRGQPGARLDRLRERVEGAWITRIYRGFLAFGGGGHRLIIQTAQPRPR